MHCYCQLAGIVNESLKPCLPQENGKKNLIFPIAKIAKRQNGKNGTSYFLVPHLHLLVNQGEEALLLRAKHLGLLFLSFGFSRPFRSRGISSSRHRCSIEGSLLLPLFYSTYLEKNGRRKKGLGGIIIHSYTGILSFPHFLYPLEKYRPSQQGSSPLPPADDQSIMRAPPYVHTFCLFHRTARLKTNNILLAAVVL